MQHNNITYEFYQALGPQSISMAEMYPIAKLPHIFNHNTVQIPWQNKRMIILADSEWRLESIYSKPKQSLYPNTLNSIRQQTITDNHQHIILKVAAHLDKQGLAQIIPNQHADELAVQGRQQSRACNLATTQPLNSFFFSQLSKHQTHSRYSDVTIPFVPEGVG